MALSKLLGTFEHDIAELVLGRAEDGEDGLMQRMRILGDTFANQLFNQAPIFIPFNHSLTSEQYQITKSKSPSNPSLTNQSEERLEPGVQDKTKFRYLEQVRKKQKSIHFTFYGAF